MSRRKIIAACVASLALSLSACGSSDDKSSDDKMSKASSSSTHSGDKSSAPGGKTSASGDKNALSLDVKGKVPVIKFPQGDAPKDLTVTVLEEGKGATITEEDLVVADYVGQVWGKSEPFDSSFKRGTPLMTQLSGVVKGWAKGLAGHKVGAKLLVTIPPSLGYGQTGQPEAGIGKNDVITFYIDVHQASNKQTAGQANARDKMDVAKLPITIQGAKGSPVTGLKVKDTSAKISKKSVSVIAKGNGPKVGKSGTITVAYAAIAPNGENFETTWGAQGQGPQFIPIGNGTVFDSLVGTPVGSRAFITVPAVTGDGQRPSTPAMYAVVDILGYVREGDNPQQTGK